MAKYFEDYDKNTFTTSSDDDKINKKAENTVNSSFRKPVYRSSSDVKNRFWVNETPDASSKNKPYTYGTDFYTSAKKSIHPVEKLEQERVARAAGVTRFEDVEPEKAESVMRLKEKRPDDYYYYQGDPKEEKKRLDEVFGAKTDFSISNFENNYNMMNREEQEMLTHKMQIGLNHFGYRDQEGMQLKTDGKLGAKTWYAYGNYKRDEENKSSNSDLMVSIEDDFQVDDVPMANPGKILQKIDDENELEIKRDNGSSDGDYVAETIAKKGAEESFMYKAQTQKERAYVRISGAHDDDIFDYNVYNDIVRQADVNYNHIHTNYKEIKNNRLAYAITKLIEMKIYYDDAETEKNNAKTVEKRNTYNEVQKIYSEAGRYLKAYIDFVVYGGSPTTPKFTSNAITEALNHENVYDGKSIDYWLKALNYALDPRNAAAVRGSSEVNMSIYDLRADLTALKDSLQIRGKAEIRGYVSGSDSRLYVRYSSDTGVLNPNVTTNKYPLYQDPTPGDPFYEMRENGIIIQQERI